MALHNRESLMKLTGKNKSYIKTYLNRKKLVAKYVDGVEYFDDMDPINASFIRKRISQKIITESINEEKITETENSSLGGLFIPVEERRPFPNSEIPIKSTQLSLDLDHEKKELTNAKLKEEIEIARIKKEKAMGEVIPTDIIINLFSNTFKAITTRFFVASEDISNTIVHQLGGNRSDMIKIRQKLRESINKAINNANNDAIKMIDGIVDEYSEQRGRGEKK